MNCGEFVELVTAFLDSALDEPMELRFLVHLTECGGCETYFEQFQQTIATLGDLPGESLTDRTRDQLMDAFHALRPE